MMIENTNLNSISPITSFNKQFNKDLNTIQTNQGQNDFQFENILSNENMKFANEPLQGGIQVVVGNEIIDGLDTSSNGNQLQNRVPGSITNVMDDISSAVSGGLNKTNNLQTIANDKIEALAAGEDVDVHDVMISAQKASLNMSLTMQLRNKFISAYQELNQIRI